MKIKRFRVFQQTLIMNKIVQSIITDQPIKIFGDGNAARDYTYIDDVISGIANALNYRDKKFDIFNIGYGTPVKLIDIIKKFEDVSGKKINIEYSDVFKGESEITWADNSKAKLLLNFNPKTNIEEGIKNYYDWFVNNALK